MLTGELVWEFGQNTMSLSPDFAERLGFSRASAHAIGITCFRDRVVREDLDLLYERMSRSFLRSEPMVNVYGLHLADGTVRRVRSLSQWKMSDAGKPTLFTASIAEVQSRLHTAVEDEFMERMIDLRFLAERAEDDRYRQIVDRMLREIWTHRRPT